MSQKVLVTYATWSGSTAGVAEEIAKVLSEKGETVDPIEAKKVKSIDDYRLVVLGSAVHAGKLNSDALNFVTRYRAALEKKTTAFFAVCLAMKEKTEESRKTAETYLEPLRTLVKPGKEGFFCRASELSNDEVSV